MHKPVYFGGGSGWHTKGVCRCWENYMESNTWEDLDAGGDTSNKKQRRERRTRSLKVQRSSCGKKKEKRGKKNKKKNYNGSLDRWHGARFAIRTKAICIEFAAVCTLFYIHSADCVGCLLCLILSRHLVDGLAVLTYPFVRLVVNRGHMILRKGLMARQETFFELLKT